jgi:hypothetical protein
MVIFRIIANKYTYTETKKDAFYRHLQWTISDIHSNIIHIDNIK